jgi:MFS family permease
MLHSAQTLAHDLETPATSPEQRSEDSLFTTIKPSREYVDTKEHVDRPPDGGYGWVCAVCVCVINIHTWGLSSSYGIFLAHYITNSSFPNAGSLEYAFVGSLSMGCAMLVSPIATYATGRLGTKATLCVGMVLEAASLFAASFAYDIWHLFLTQGVLFGFGMGLLFVPSVAIVPQWFTTKQSLANGISASGTGLGGVLYSFASDAMIRNLGLPWAFRILGILVLVANGVSIILIKDRHKIIQSNQQAFSIVFLKRFDYILLSGFAWFSMFGHLTLVYSLSKYSNSIGLNSSQGALVTALFNLGQAIGRPLIGYFSDRTGRINMAMAMTFLASALSFALWTNSKAYGTLIFFAITSGSVAGTFWSTIGPIVAELVGLRDVPAALNLMWLLIVLPCTFSEPIALQIVEETGGFLGTQLFVGSAYIAAGLCLLFCYVLRRTSARK